MGQMWIDTAIANARELIPRDLAAARQRANELVRDSPTPSGRVQALSLLVDILARSGKLDAALCLYRDAREEGFRRRASRLARADLAVKGAIAYEKADRLDEAAGALTEARELLAEPLEKSSNNASPGGARRARALRTVDASRMIVEGWLALRHDPAAAYRLALEAAERSDADRIQLAALSLLSIAAVKLEKPGSLAAVLEMCSRAEARLRRRRSPPRLYVLKLRWIRALTLARAGLAENAEEILFAVSDELSRSPWQEDAGRAREDLQSVRSLVERQEDALVSPGQRVAG